MNQTTGSPIADPTVTVGVEVLSLRYSLIAEYKISEAGLEPAAILKALSPVSGDPKRFYYIVQLFAACVAHNYVIAGKQAPSADQWTQRLQALEPDEEKLRVVLRQIGAGVVEAVLKRLTAPQAAAQPSQTEAPRPQ